VAVKSAGRLLLLAVVATMVSVGGGDVVTASSGSPAPSRGAPGRSAGTAPVAASDVGGSTPRGTATASDAPANPLVPAGDSIVGSLSHHVTPSCSGTGTDGNRVQVLYVRTAETPSRFTSVLPRLRNEVANVDDVFAVSAEQTGGVRRVRWVHDDSCVPIVTSVTLPKGSLGADFWTTVAAMRQVGFKDPHRKYLMFADTNRMCGMSTLYDDASRTRNVNDGTVAMYSRVDEACWSAGHSVAAHELTHTLGAVELGAPHATANGHCYDESDLMCYDDGSGVKMRNVCPSSQEQLLDCGHDDYFSTDPRPGSWLAKHWNTADSSFLDDAVVPPPAPDVAVKASATSVRPGATVTITASSKRSVAWAWNRSASGSSCTLTPTSGRATLTCPPTVKGVVTVTATATDSRTAARGSAKVDVTVAAQ
jgi:hypothetical protein